MTPFARVTTMHGVMSAKFFLRDVAKRIAWTAKHPLFELRLAWYRFNPFPLIVGSMVIGNAFAGCLLSHERSTMTARPSLPCAAPLRTS